MGVDDVVLVLDDFVVVVVVAVVVDVVLEDVEPELVPETTKATIAYAGTLAVARPPLMLAESVATELLLSVTYALTEAAASPLTATLTVWAELPALMTWTVTVPSAFLNAAKERPVPEPEVPTRTAPGRTKRDHIANAQRRLLTSMTFPLVIRINETLVLQLFQMPIQ